MSTIARYNWEDRIINPETGKEEAVVHKNDIRWDAANHGFAMCDGYEEYAQTIEAVVKTDLGELQTNREYGIPYFTTVFRDRRHNEIWEAAVRDAVSELSFVKEINSFEYEYDENRLYLTYTLVVTVDDGRVITVTD